MNQSPLPSTRVGVFVFDGFEPIDVWGPIQAFVAAAYVGTSVQSGPPPFRVTLIANEDRVQGDEQAAPRPVAARGGVRVAPDLFRDQALTQDIDLLLIPGGLALRELLSPDRPVERAALLRWAVRMDERVSLMTSVCTGAAVLAAAGLLDGQPAATNHLAFHWVTSLGPRVKWDNVARWVDAGRYVTSAGVSAGTDMAFYLVQRLYGRAVAEQAARVAEYDWRRDPEEPVRYPEQAPVPTTPWRPPATTR
ncbi:MAG: DJ-1/PfpI family protein [Alphaproteobacteria bacterium]|nr:DJ-1/PfpI family protein [Alphaproteobacteria bacterium]